MTAVKGILLVLHLLGMAAIIGPWLAAPRQGRIRAAMVWGARAQVVTGLLLVAAHQMSGDPADRLNNTKVAVKLVVAVACAACAEVANGRQRRAAAGTAEDGATPTTVLAPPAAGLVHAAALLAVLNVVIAVLWV